MRVRLSALLLILGLFLAFAPSAFAAGDTELARELTELGIEAQERGDHGAALTFLDRAVAEVNHPKIRYFRAKSLRGVGRFEDALAEFKAIESEPAVAKYRAEIDVFITAIEGDQERLRLEEELARVRAGLGAAETEADRLAREAEDARIAADRAEAERAAAAVAAESERERLRRAEPTRDERREARAAERERQRSLRPEGRGMMIAGWVTFGVSYALTALTASGFFAAEEDETGTFLLIPIAGPWIAIIDIEGDAADSIGQTFFGILGVAQAVGLGLGIAGSIIYTKDKARIDAMQAVGGFPLTDHLTINTSVIIDDDRLGLTPTLVLGGVF